jgi:hypothetical protein
VLFLVFGSSASGKTTALDVLRLRPPERLAIHDFDEIGIPSGATKRFRHEANARWVRRALEYQHAGVDVLLAGQTSYGELLATPSANRLDALAACLLDCRDEVRADRLHARGPEWWSRSSGSLSDYLAWAEWMRRHAADPRHLPEVLSEDGSQPMRWERWSGWLPGDPRWRVRVLDSSSRSVEQVAAELRAWIAEERARYSITSSSTGRAAGALSASS